MFDDESLLPFQNGRSVGLKNGVHIGRQQGQEAGYTEGWNSAINECNPIIENLKAQCVTFRDERDDLARQLASMQQNYATLSASKSAAVEVAVEYKVAFSSMQTIAIAFYQQLVSSKALTPPAIKEILLCIDKEAKAHKEPMPWECKKIKEVLPKLINVFEGWRREASKASDNDVTNNR